MTKDPWDLVRTQQYAAAAREYSRLGRANPSRESHRFNRGTVYLLMGKYRRAFNDFHAIVVGRDPLYAASGEFAMAGICCWYLDLPTEALKYWRAGLSVPYRDAAGGVEIPALLLYASQRLGDILLQKEAIRLLKGLWKKHLHRQQERKARSRPSHHNLVHPRLFAWPGAIVPFLLGETDETSLKQSADGINNRILQVRWRCAADFYIGLRALREDDQSGFKKAMRRCAASTRGELEHEYYLARWEVNNGFPATYGS